MAGRLIIQTARDLRTGALALAGLRRVLPVDRGLMLVAAAFLLLHRDA